MATQTKHALWLGSQDSFDELLEANARVSADTKFNAASSYEDDVLRKIYNVQGGVAVITVNGSLVDGSAGYGVYYGVTGYDDVRNALAKAVEDQDVNSVLLNISSGGGRVAGVHELGQLVQRVNAVKPVVTYTGSTMGSAAVWLGVGAGYIVAAETAIVGSIGIILVHADRSKMYEEMGVKHTVLRAGSEKALASPYEELSEQARATLQKQADTMYGVFIKHVADARGVDVELADVKFGQGREFVGRDAVKAGLVDKVGTFEDAYAKASNLGLAARNGGKRGAIVKRGASASTSSANVTAQVDAPEMNAGDNPANSSTASQSQGTSMLKPLTEEQLAAMAAGIDLQDESEPTAPEASKGEDGEGEDDSSAEPEALVTAKAELATATEALATAKAEAEAATAQLTALQAEASQFVEIVRASVKTMGLHFGLKADVVAALSSAEVLAEHTRIAGLFKSKFKVGGVAATTPEEVKSASAVVANPLFAAVLRSTAK